VPVEPVRGQILSLTGARPPLRSIVWGEGAYLVPKRDGSLVVGATEERVGYDCRVTAEGVEGLLAAARELVPPLARAEFAAGWAGLRPASPDGMPAISAVAGAAGLYVAVGHSRNGVLLSPITGRLVADLVLGKELPPDAAVFDLARF
jgi:glycine oxidase